MHEVSKRFRRFLPIVIDIETGGLNAQTSPIVEIALYFLTIENDFIKPDNFLHFHIKPFEGAVMEPKSLDFISYHDYDKANQQDEQAAFTIICEEVKKRVKQENCTRAILIGHNAHFDLAFFNEAIKRCQLSSPFHTFSTLDTVSLSALMYGQTVLCQACQMAGIEWDNNQAHNALYDCQKTATLFCQIVNQSHSTYSANKSKFKQENESLSS